MSNSLSVKKLLEVPASFIATAKAFPANVDKALAMFDTAEEVGQMLVQADTLEHYARRVKADTTTINYISYGKIKIEARLGELDAPPSAAIRGKSGGRGRKKAPSPAEVALSLPAEVRAKRRKIAANKSKIDEYMTAAMQTVETDDPTEMSSSGFIRFVSSDGNLKAHQNKGVIEWYTPEKYIEAARDAMGSIDLDPASNTKAQKVVKAETFYTASDDGLKKDWAGNVFLNPPFKADLIKAFVSKLVASFSDGVTTQAILLTNNNTDTLWWHEAAEVAAAICFTKGRIPFYSPAGETAAPTNGHTIAYLGKRRAAFSKAFKVFGLILTKDS